MEKKNNSSLERQIKWANAANSVGLKLAVGGGILFLTGCLVAVKGAEAQDAAETRLRELKLQSANKLME